MLELAFSVLFLAIACHVHGSQADSDLLQNSQCAGYCFNAIKPMMDFVTGHQNTRLIQFQEKLEQLELQLASLPRNVASTKFREVPTHKIILPNFIQIGSKSYFIEERKKLAFFEASNTCRQMGGELVSIQSEEELNKLTEQLTLTDWYWTDINELHSLDSYDYRSFNTGERVTFTKWTPGRPNHSYGRHCVQLKNGTMYDEECHEKVYFICQSRD